MQESALCSCDVLQGQYATQQAEDFHRALLSSWEAPDMRSFGFPCEGESI